MERITIQNFSRRYGDFLAVDDLSFTVDEGEIFGFLGRNGAGKTTTIRTLIGIQEPDEGKLLIDGKPFGPDLRSRIGYLPEERGVYLRATVRDAILYMARLRGLSRSEATRKMEAWLERMRLSEHAGKRIQNLSSGMQQKVQIIATLIHEPEILVLDEPFRGLDPINRQIVYDILMELKQAGRTILFSSHEIHEVEHFCDRVVLMAGGKARAYGRVADLKEKFGHPSLRIGFEGNLPELEGVRWSSVHQDSAEGELLENADSQEILQKLVQAVRVFQFELARPSLNTIFLNLCGDEVKE